MLNLRSLLEWTIASNSKEGHAERNIAEHVPLRAHLSQGSVSVIDGRVVEPGDSDAGYLGG